jgi:uncharacterized protein YjbJ (UPF0337 family)
MVELLQVDGVVKHHDISVNTVEQGDVPHLLDDARGARRHACEGRRHRQKETTVMAIGDKISNAAEGLGGKAKEAAGKATDNEQLEAEGQTDQGAAKVKKVGEDVKDVFR